MNDPITSEQFDNFWNENISDLIQLIDHLKNDITDEMKDSDDESPYMQLTISVNNDCTTWSYQTGDNSCHGSCYGDPYWGVGYITKDQDSKNTAKDLIEDLADQIFW